MGVDCKNIPQVIQPITDRLQIAANQMNNEFIENLRKNIR